MACVTQIVIHPARAEDVQPMLYLERQAGTAAHWSKAQYEAIFQPGAPSRLGLVAERGEMLGFLVAQTAGPEWELENLVVAPSARRQGVGRELVCELLRLAGRQGASAILLEVRASNAAALALYQACGFVRSGSRPGYYQNPREDAIICSYDLKR
jgi:ribosomal-protein-alanine N-acetyltransferase